MAVTDSSDISSDSDSSFELEIESIGVMHPFMFEPQHGTSSKEEGDSNMAQDPPEAVEAKADETTRSRLTVPALIAKLCHQKREASHGCQGVKVLGDCLNLEGRNETFIINNKQLN